MMAVFLVCAPDPKKKVIILTTCKYIASKALGVSDGYN